MTTRVFEIAPSLRMLPLVALLVVWEMVGGQGPRERFLYSTPSEIVAVFAGEVRQFDFWVDVFTTASYVVVGYCVGNALGTGGGLVLWLLPVVGQVLLPYLVVLSSLPVFAIVPLFIIWFGVGFAGKVALVAFSTAFVAMFYTLTGAREVGVQYDELVHTLGGGRGALFRRLVLRGAVVQALEGYKLNVGFSLIGAYVAEWVSASSGIGHYVQKATSLYDVPRVVVGLAVFSVFALGMTSLVDRAGRLLVGEPMRREDGARGTTS